MMPAATAALPAQAPAFQRRGTGLAARLAHGAPAAMKWLWLAELAVGLLLPLLALFRQSWFDGVGQLVLHTLSAGWLRRAALARRLSLSH
ncbi:hypothetical protein QO239_13565 [Cupriavidus taiwanensis]|uniref:hypothetical protein n=1 Tax=Cupriavidus taiwanensis TaxID=164546 RepID=UPI0025411C3F|nr:hypothetical protein [Cupriavidus taiwanensis]MDK3023626.1 hypothetical protein [Cupriavidus taiwanensis]